MREGENWVYGVHQYKWGTCNGINKKVKLVYGIMLGYVHYKYKDQDGSPMARFPFYVRGKL